MGFKDEDVLEIMKNQLGSLNNCRRRCLQLTGCRFDNTFLHLRAIRVHRFFSCGLRVMPLFGPFGGGRVSTPTADLLNESLNKYLSREGKLQMHGGRVFKGALNVWNLHL